MKRYLEDHERYSGDYIPTDKRPPLPREVREEVLKRAGGRCEECRKQCSGDIHHEHYMCMHHSEDLTEPADLLYLCRDCHMAKHRDPFGVWWNDPKEMETFFYGYWKAMEED